MATLQVKNLPDDLHAALRARAQRESTTLSELVTRLLERELALPSMAEWLDELDRVPRRGVDVDIEGLMDEVRAEPVDPQPAPRRRARR